ncbi:MAG: hypothetical protein IKS67_01865, partial [Victivallales bacterium]|nr:hypothetical protein [Victivallales bacterium]
DRYVVAKVLSKSESEDAYEALKEYWRDFVYWLYDHGAEKMDKPSLEKLLASGSDLFPLFLKAKA